MQRLLLTFLVVLSTTLFAQQEDESEGDSSASLPAEYADYLVASNTLSPDKRIAVIYPKKDVCLDDPKPGTDDRCQDYLVALQPFRVLIRVDTKFPEFQGRNHGGMSATWTSDGSAALVTLESKWGPGDIFLYEIANGELHRSTPLLRKVHDLLKPAFSKAKARYNDYFDFIFEAEEDTSALCEFVDQTHVRIKGRATTDPKRIPGERAWDGVVTAVWDIPAARFTSSTAKTIFAGKRKEDDSER